MGRSVSFASGSMAVAYQVPELCYTDEDGIIHYDVAELWDDYKEGLRTQIECLFPSMKVCDEWLGQEDLAIMENAHAHIGISEYCGLVSIWLKPKLTFLPDTDANRHNNAARFWCNQVKGRFMREFNQYNKIGTFSNGEAIYERTN